MKKLLTSILCLFFLCFSVKVKAQLLFEETFNSYPAGHLNTDYTNTTVGQGGWLLSRGGNATGAAMVVAEAGKGNVLILTGTDAVNFRQDYSVIDVLWNNRTAGNNILKFEYEFYGIDNFIFGGGVLSQGSTLINTPILSTTKRINGAYYKSNSINTTTLINYNTTPFPYNMWFKVEMFIDYNTKNVYFYLPTLNLQKSDSFSHNRIPDNINFTVNSLNSSSVIKIDNIKFSALQTLPPYILSTNEQLATKFNMYPNPATNVVNITNNENMLVNQVTVYDITGKQLSAQSFNNQTEIQLNVENLASGTYMLHLQTEEGIAVKKLVKK